MRWVPTVAAVVVLTGCGGSPALVERAPEGNKAVRPKHPPRCTHVSRGYRACTTFGFPIRGERSWIQHREGVRWETFAGPPKARRGWWRRVAASPDRTMLLAQWSGECEIQSIYLVFTANGEERPIFRGSSSTAVGWSMAGRARVRLPSPLYGTDKSIRIQSGIYLVDPKTMEVSLEHPIARRPGC
jgi:hypothetical protein